MQIDSLTEDIEQTANQDEACRRLRQIPGVGCLVATVVVASIGNGAAFHKGREFAAWLGLVPRQYSSGDKPKLLGISKRGNRAAASPPNLPYQGCKSGFARFSSTDSLRFSE